MSNFTDPLDVRQDGDEWVTLRDFSYWTDCEESEAPLSERCRTRIVVPAGFRTDFASIPRLLWPLIGHPAGRYAQAASLHDWLYRNHLVSRAEADRIFREAMGTLGVPAWKRSLMWAAVRVGGHGAYAAPEGV